jgi:hypothetical protein
MATITTCSCPIDKVGFAHDIGEPVVAT